MKLRHFFYVFIALYSQGALFASTSQVYVINNTSTDLTMNFWGQDGGNTLKKGDVYKVPPTGTLKAGQKTQILDVSRTSGISNNKEFYFREDINLPGFGIINLKQKLRGKVVASDIWIAVAQNNQNYTWYGDGKHSIIFGQGPDAYTVTYYYESGGVRDDIVYEISRARWVPEFLPGNLRFDQICWLTAHNAFSNREEGFKLRAQQNKSIMNQIKNYNVRGLMLDVYDYQGDVALCHQSCSKVYQKSVGELIAKGFGVDPSYKTLYDTLKNIKNWLDENPNAVITVFLENYVNTDKLAEKIRSVPGLNEIILDKKAWDALQYDGRWPTLQWMRDNKKRIVFFLEDKSNTPVKDDHPFFPTWQYITENVYGEQDPNKVCTERPESQKLNTMKRGLYLMNFFGKGTSGKETIGTYDNPYDSIMNAINGCKQKGFAGGKTPNYLALDFVDIGAGPRIVEELNKKLIP